LFANHLGFRLMGAEVKDVAVVGFFQPRQGGLAADEDGAGVDGLHEVIAFDREVGDALQAYGAGVVDQAVDAAEVVGGLFA